MKKMLFCIIGIIFISSLCLKTHALEYSTTAIETNSTVLPDANQIPVQANTVKLNDFDRVESNLNQAINDYEEEKLAQEELKKRIAEENRQKQEAKKQARLKAVQAMQGEISENVASGSLYSLAESYVGRAGDCFQLAIQLLNEYFGSGYTSNGSYQVSEPQEGDLIYYSDGGLGTTHYGVYLGNGLAFQGNWGGAAKIGTVYLNNASDPIFYRYA